jgi:hypothetical protein
MERARKGDQMPLRPATGTLAVAVIMRALVERRSSIRWRRRGPAPRLKPARASDPIRRGGVGYASFGAASVKTRGSPSVTTTSSSMRIPIPRYSRGTFFSSGLM